MLICLQYFAKPYAITLDLIVYVMDSTPQLPFKGFLYVLYVYGRFVTVGIPGADEPLLNGCYIGDSIVGSEKEWFAMFKLATQENIELRIEELPIKEARKALEGVTNNRVRYRYVLTHDLTWVPDAWLLSGSRNGKIVRLECVYRRP
jgi:alcohol dehydrogenase (NADP+)